jgi:cytochrome bd ubiquinol oxidase subunit I
VPSSLIALTLALYVTLYLALIVAYIGVVKYMAEEPLEPLAAPLDPQRTPQVQA